LDLYNGTSTRKRQIDIKIPIKGSVTVDPRGYPLLYVGQGIETEGNISVGFQYRIFSLVDMQLLFSIPGNDFNAGRPSRSFDSSARFDKNNDSIYKLNYKGQKEKICADEKCRNNIDKPCDHLPIFGYLYSDGYLYFTYGGYDTTDVEVKVWYNEYETRQKTISAGVFIYRYDIDTYQVEKLIEFQGITNCELALNGRYLYAMTYTWEMSAVTNSSYKADFAITRIDLFQENAVIVYSDLMNRDDFDKISEHISEFRFINDKIIMPVYNSITICNLDLYNIKTLIEFSGNENVRDLYLYETDIYFLSDKGLSRVSIERYNQYLKEFAVIRQDDKTALLDSDKREILNANINNFCIDEEFLYYTVNGENNLYRIKLDYSHELPFNNAVTAYTPVSGESLNYHDWKVCDGYLYSITFTEDGRENSGWRYRQKLISESEPYLFFKEY